MSKEANFKFHSIYGTPSVRVELPSHLFNAAKGWLHQNDERIRVLEASTPFPSIKHDTKDVSSALHLANETFAADRSSMTSSKEVAFVLVPGGFCPGEYFRKVTDKLTALNYTTIAVDNPSSDGTTDKTPTPGFYDDVANVDKVVAELADQGKHVILAGNSYGGFVVTQAGQGLSKDERQASGKSDGGGLAAIVLIGSLLGPLGITCQELVSGEIPVDTESQTSAYLTPLDPKVAGQYLFPSLDEEEQLYWAKMARKQSQVAFSQKLTYTSYEHFPTTVVTPTNDACIRPSLHYENFDAAMARGLKTVKRIKLEADHCAMISHPDEIVKILLDIAKEL